MSRRTVIRAGYSIVVAVLILSTAQAYRIQANASERQLDHYRAFVERDEILTRLRRHVWMAGNVVRDFFISDRADRGSRLAAELADLKSRNLEALARLDAISQSPSQNSVLRSEMMDLWKTTEPIAVSMLNSTNALEFSFVQNEVAPRRTRLYDLLREITLRDQQVIQESEARFSAERRSGASRLVVMLTMAVLLCIFVSQFSSRHADALELETARQYGEVANAKRELQELAARQLELAEEERRRLARELHDEIGQTLAVLQMEISSSEKALSRTSNPIAVRLQRSTNLISGVVQTIRNISLLLRPALLDDLGLGPALQWQLEDFMRRSGIRCDFESKGNTDDLPEPVKTAVYRVIQEALHNTEKHAQASRVQVQLRVDDSRLLAEVRDDGHGFILNGGGSAKPAGLGIIGMRERIANVGGRLWVESAPGSGTHVRLEVPLSTVTGVCPAAPVRFASA